MFTVTDAAKQEIEKRFKEFPNMKLIRVEMRNSCWMKMRLKLEESAKENDIECTVDGLDFVVDKDHEHYFTNKVIDYRKGDNGFMDFYCDDVKRELSV